MTTWPDDDLDPIIPDDDPEDDAPAELPDEPESWWESPEPWENDSNRPFWIDEP